jgi:hypothetical protein
LNITVTRIQVQLGVAPVKCQTLGAVQVTDGNASHTSTIQLPAGLSSIDSGPLTIDYDAGVAITTGVSVAANCKTAPQLLNVVVQYKER